MEQPRHNEQVHISPKLQELITAAERGEDADWEFIDEKLPGALDDDSFNWVFSQGLDSRNDNIRDLAASLIENWDGPLDNDQVLKIVSMMQFDTHLPVRFRLAAGRLKRGDDSHFVVRTLQEAAVSGDEVMEPLAKELLSSVDDA
jgi:hypothetical protein